MPTPSPLAGGRRRAVRQRHLHAAAARSSSAPRGSAPAFARRHGGARRGVVAADPAGGGWTAAFAALNAAFCARTAWSPRGGCEHVTIGAACISSSRWRRPWPPARVVVAGAATGADAGRAYAGARRASASPTRSSRSLPARRRPRALPPAARARRFHVDRRCSVRTGARAAAPRTRSRSARRSRGSTSRSTPRGERRRAELNGLFLADGTQHLDYAHAIDHAAGTTSQRELSRHRRRARPRRLQRQGHRRRPARRRPTPQTKNRNLLLTGAEIDTKPRAGDLRRRREVRARRDDRPARRGRALLPALARHRRRSEPRALLIYAFAGAMVSRSGRPVRLARAQCPRVRGAARRLLAEGA